jgi:hypothetical protein
VTERGGGRHSSPAGQFPRTEAYGFGVPRYEPARYEVPPYVTGGIEPVGREAGTGPVGRRPDVMDRRADQTGPLVEPYWWSYGSQRPPRAPPERPPQQRRQPRTSDLERRRRRPAADPSLRAAAAPAVGGVGPAPRA